jgi:hypothetical protein
LGLQLGVADFGQYREQDVARLFRVATRLRFGVVRLTMEWTPGQTRIGPTQRRTVAVARRFTGVRVLYTLSFVRGRDAPTTERARRQFVAWATDLVRHGAADVEATNEPMQPLFWSTSGAAGQYAALLGDLYGALHRANPRVTVIAGSLARRRADVFMAELTRALRGRRVADEVSLHYPASVRDFRHRVGLLRRAFGALPVDVTEDGSTLAGGRARAAQVAREIRLAAREHAGMWILLQLQDRLDLMPWQTGLYRSDWKRLPTYYAVVRTEAALRADRREGRRPVLAAVDLRGPGRRPVARDDRPRPPAWQWAGGPDLRPRGPCPAAARSCRPVYELRTRLQRNSNVRQPGSAHEVRRRRVRAPGAGRPRPAALRPGRGRL